MNIPVTLRVTDLAELLGLSRKQAVLLVRHHQIVWHRQGRRRFVYLSQVKEQMPEIWQSLLARSEVLSGGLG